MTVGSVDLGEDVYAGAPGKHLLIIYSYRENEGVCKKVDVYQKVILP
jgi:hypothetical protein